MPALPLGPSKMAFIRTTTKRLSPRRSLGNKLQEIAFRSRRDLEAFDVLADMVLDRLNADEQGRQRKGY